MLRVRFLFQKHHLPLVVKGQPCRFEQKRAQMQREECEKGKGQQKLELMKQESVQGLRQLKLKPNRDMNKLRTYHIQKRHRQRIWLLLWWNRLLKQQYIWLVGSVQHLQRVMIGQSSLGVSISAITRISYKWIKVMFIRIIKWPLRDTLQKNFQQAFKNRCPTVVCIIDCPEVFNDRPTSFPTRDKTCSLYKKHNIIEFMIERISCATISCISKWWGGTVSDRYLTGSWDS